MKLEEAIYRIKIHKECAGLENGTCIVNIKDLETLLKEPERLQEENNKLERANKTYINSIQSITPVLLEDYIEKEQMREKLEELQKQYKEALQENSTKAFILKCQIEILKEVLE